MNFKIIDETTNETLFYGSLRECEQMLTYFLNHDHEAYLIEVAS